MAQRLLLVAVGVDAPRLPGVARQSGRDLGVAPLWWTLAAAVSWSRVHVGVHHGSDLVGGAALGAALGRLSTSVWPPRVPSEV